ncbi:hypothetical protein [Sorangium sp. So ce590]|uniref:hypothetical protein n=1 Tax=unclassified Sorangium TaxID=2621164 RepID=UPI003F6228F3
MGKMTTHDEVKVRLPRDAACCSPGAAGRPREQASRLLVGAGAGRMALPALTPA